jgi:hypothetical protein
LTLTLATGSCTTEDDNMANKGLAPLGSWSAAAFGVVIVASGVRASRGVHWIGFRLYLHSTPLPCC